VTEWSKFCHKKLVFVAAHSEDFMIVACTVFIKLQGETDGRTDA